MINTIRVSGKLVNDDQDWAFLKSPENIDEEKFKLEKNRREVKKLNASQLDQRISVIKRLLLMNTPQDEDLFLYREMVLDILTTERKNRDIKYWDSLRSK